MAGLAAGFPIGDNNVGTGVYTPAREDRRPKRASGAIIDASENHTSVLEGMPSGHGELCRNRAADVHLLPLSHQQRDCRTGDRKSTRLNSSHLGSSYAVF